MRVAKIDWCASRNVVSVNKISPVFLIHSITPFTPFSSKISLEPLGIIVSVMFIFSISGNTIFSFIFIPSCSFTMLFPKNESNLVARSLPIFSLSNSGCLSINSVQKYSSRKIFDLNTFSKKGIFVFTPLILNSFRDRIIFFTACSNVNPHEVTLTNNES